MTPALDDDDRARARGLRVALAGATLANVGLSWPLWIDLDGFPAVPFVGWYPDLPRGWSGPMAVGLAAGLGLALTERFARAGLAASALLMAWLVLGDQLRLQPWAYQYLVMATLLVALPEGSALAFSRVYLASMYLYSGLSKLDASFVQEMGPLFVRTLARIVPAPLPGRGWALLALSGFEIVVGALLLIRSTRGVGYVGLVLLHAALLAILGPWGLGHSAGVLVWNVGLAIEEFFAFWPIAGPRSAARRWNAREVGIGVPFALVLGLPLLERAGLFDSWPSHALYASHCERSAISIRGEGFARLPTALRVAAVPEPDGTWVLNPTDWTRAVRGVPAYPQRRYANGLAEWIAGRVESTRVDHWSRADPVTGIRAESRDSGLVEIRARGDRFWFNAHPRGR